MALKEKLFRIDAINQNFTFLIKRKNFVRLSFLARHFHARRTDRHSRYAQADYVWLFLQQLYYFCFWYMSLQYVAIDDGCMARLEFHRDFVSGFELRDVTNIL